MVSALAPEEGRNLLPVPGMWAFRSSGSTPPKPIDARMVTMAVVLQGRKQVSFRDRDLDYGPGQYLFVTGEQRYVSAIHDASPRAPYLSFAIELAPEELAPVLLELADAEVEPGGALADPGGLVSTLAPALEEAVRRVVRFLREPVDRKLLLPLAKQELLIQLLRGEAGRFLRRAAAGDDGRIRRALGFLESRAFERVTVAEAARHVRMSPSHFAHRFREVVRMSPMQYVKHLRLQQARLRMLGDGMGAAEAALAVGYASASQFTREFKGYFGEPPRAHVERLRAG